MIDYSHVNEDNRIERDLLINSKCKTVVAVCGSGERVVALMDPDNCKKILVVDSNSHAIFLLQLKIIALTHLSVQEYLQFIGHCDLEGDRLLQYQFIRKHLPPETRDFWDRHSNEIRQGVLFAGNFEKFLSRIRPCVALYLGNNFFKIFSEEPVNCFPKIRWRILLQLFSLRIIYRLAGNHDIAFTGKGAKLLNISQSLQQLIEKNRISSSYIGHLIFKGDLKQMSSDEMPPSLQSEVLQNIKSRLVRGEIKIEYYAMDLLLYIKKYSLQFSDSVFYSASDILSYTDFHYIREIIQELKHPGDVFVGRGFVRNRLSPQALEALANYGKVESYDHLESSFMYQVFSITKAS